MKLAINTLSVFVYIGVIAGVYFGGLNGTL